MKLSTLIDYFTLLFKRYSDIQKAQIKSTFRLLQINNTNNQVEVLFQMIGKSLFMRCSAAYILSNDQFMEKFSKKDIQQMTYALAQERNKCLQMHNENNLKLIRQEFDITNNKTKFIFSDKKGNFTLKTAAEISLDKKMINQLSRQDAVNIGYTAGYEHSQYEIID